MSGLAQFLLLGPFFHEGQIVPSPKLYHYLPGTTQEKTAWMDRGKAITAANPIEGDANGLVYGFFSGVYKLVVKTHDGTVTLFQADGVQILDTVDDNVQPTVRPEDHGGEASSSVDNTDPILASLADLPPRVEPWCSVQGIISLVGRSTNGTDISSTKARERA